MTVPDMVLTAIGGSAAMVLIGSIVDPLGGGTLPWRWRLVALVVGLAPFCYVIELFSHGGFWSHVIGTALSIPAILPGLVLHNALRRRYRAVDDPSAQAKGEP